MTRPSTLFLFLWLLVSNNLLSLHASSCPPEAEEESLYYCDNPDDNFLDDTVHCDTTTCRWDLDALDPDQAPIRCQLVNDLGISTIQNLPDYLEPCLWWEMMYGRLQQLLPSFLPQGAPFASPTAMGT